MSVSQELIPPIDDTLAYDRIIKLQSPVREAVASLVWWHSVSRYDMPSTFNLMDPWQYPRTIPTSEELVQGLVQIGISEKWARTHVISDDKYAEERENHLAHMRRIHAKEREERRRRKNAEK